MYIFVPFFFFIWGGLTIAYCQFDFQPEWLVAILAAGNSDDPVDAFFLTTRGGLVLIGVGVFCLLWIFFRVRLYSGTSNDTSSFRDELHGLGEDVLDIFSAFFTPVSSVDDTPEQKSPSLLDEFLKSSNAPESLCDDNGCNYRIVERRLNGEIRLENDDIVHTSDGYNYYGSDDTKYFDRS